MRTTRRPTGGSLILRLPPGYTYAQVSGVVADNPDRIIVGIRGDRTPEGEERPNSSNYIVVVDGNGDVTERWTQWDTLLGFPHQLYINPYDPERHIWVVERGGTRRGSTNRF